MRESFVSKSKRVADGHDPRLEVVDDGVMRFVVHACGSTLVRGVLVPSRSPLITSSIESAIAARLEW
ncbi:MAG: hypothetical protein ACF8PN_04180 [Phycisphaerales bacterium]